VDKKLIERIRDHFEGKKYLFEHSGKQYNWVSMTSLIKLESLKVLDKNISAHTLRHSYATHALKKTGRIRAVQEQLGHSSASTTIDLYVHDSFSWEDQEEMFN
jgi:integrase/recombinase XerD